MPSFKAPVQAHINHAIHMAFPPARVEALQREGSLIREVELWLELLEDCVPREWRRDLEAMGLKYALTALRGEGGVLWEPRFKGVLYEGDISLCEVLRPLERCRRDGTYATRKGRLNIRQYYLPEVVGTTTAQGEGNCALVDGRLHAIAWPFHLAQRKSSPADWDGILGERPF